MLKILTTTKNQKLLLVVIFYTRTIKVILYDPNVGPEHWTFVLRFKLKF